MLVDGWTRLTTARVAQRAGVSVGTLYQYFPNKQALLFPVLERHLEILVNTIEAACGDHSGTTVKASSFPGSAGAQQADPAGVFRILLGGPTPTRPSPLTVPSFAWKLTDQEVADVATYVRNRWDNRASPVPARWSSKARDADAFAKPGSLSRLASP